MHELSEQIQEIEQLIEKALWDLELHEKLEQALAVYLDAENKLNDLSLTADHPLYREKQRVLAYCLMRQGNLLRQMEKPQEAQALGEREIAAARASGDEITLARSLMSNGTNLIVTGGLERGLLLIDEARELFERGKSVDHRQGLGWYWILQADLANAGLVERYPYEVIEMADHALVSLEPIENWPGVARAYAARAKAHERLGNVEQAARDRRLEAEYEGRIEPEENTQ